MALYESLFLVCFRLQRSRSVGAVNSTMNNNCSRGKLHAPDQAAAAGGKTWTIASVR